MSSPHLINQNISTFNVVLFFVGFDLATSLSSIFIGNSAENSQLITIPIRGLMLLISLITILINLKSQSKFSFGIYSLFFYFFLIIIRLYYDLGIRTDIDTYRSDQTQMLLVFTSMLITTFSIFKSFRSINFERAFRLIYVGFAIILVVNFFNFQGFTAESVNVNEQVTTGIRNSIATGYTAAIFLLLSLVFYSDINRKWLTKALFVPVLIAAIFILLRAGSRGPFFSVFIGTIVYFALRGKNIVIILMSGSILALLFIFFFENIIELVGEISPVMAFRLEYTMVEGDKPRLEYFNAGLEGFLNNPLFGSYAFVYTDYEWYEYPHQMLIEAFMATGILGGLALAFVLLIVIKNIILTIRNKIAISWLALIALIYFIRAMTAGTIYFGDYAVILILMLMINPEKK